MDAKSAKLSRKGGAPIFSPSRLLAALCRSAPQFKVGNPPCMHAAACGVCAGSSSLQSVSGDECRRRVLWMSCQSVWVMSVGLHQHGRMQRIEGSYDWRMTWVASARAGAAAAGQPRAVALPHGGATGRGASRAGAAEEGAGAGPCLGTSSSWPLCCAVRNTAHWSYVECKEMHSSNAWS